MYLFLTQCFPSRLGGIESLVSNLALSLSEQKKILVFADKNYLIQDALFDDKYKNCIYPVIKMYKNVYVIIQV